MQAIDIGKGNIVLNTLVLNQEAEDVVVMVHGMFGNIAQFYMSIAPELAKNFRIVMYDIKCHGKSSRHDTGYDLLSLADDIRCLLDTLKIDKCYILGFSFGTLIALKFAMEFKDRVKGLIALEIPIKSYLPNLLKGSYDFSHFLGFTDWLPEAAQQNFMGNNRIANKNFEMIKYIINNTSFIEDLNLEKEFEEKDYQNINTNMLLMFGKESVFMKELERIKNWIKYPEIILMKGGHFFPIDDAFETSLIIKDFIIKTKSLEKNSTLGILKN